MSSFVNPVDEETAKLAERQLQSTPLDYSLRESLVEYYFSRKISRAGFFLASLTRGFWIPKSARSLRKHVLWFIRNAPTNDFAGTPAVRLAPDLDPQGCKLAVREWKLSIDKSNSNVAVIRNAFETFKLNDRGYAREILLIAQKKEPTSLEWSYKLMKLHADSFRNEIPRLSHVAQILFWKWQSQAAEESREPQVLLHCLQKRLDCERELSLLDKQLGLWTRGKQRQIEMLEKKIHVLQQNGY